MKTVIDIAEAILWILVLAVFVRCVIAAIRHYKDDSKW